MFLKTCHFHSLPQTTPFLLCDNEHIHWIGITWNHRWKKQDMSILCRLRLCHLGQDLLLCFGMIALFQIRCQHLGDHTLVHLAVKGGSARDVAQWIHTVRANDFPYGFIRGPSTSSIEKIDILMNIVSKFYVSSQFWISHMWQIRANSRRFWGGRDAGMAMNYNTTTRIWTQTFPLTTKHAAFKANPHTNSHWLHSLKASI